MPNGVRPSYVENEALIKDVPLISMWMSVSEQYELVDWYKGGLIQLPTEPGDVK